MTGNRPIGEDDLHGFVDGVLDAARSDEVRSWLAGHPDTARKVTRMADQRDALRRRFGPIADEPVPTALSLRPLLEKRRTPRRRAWVSVAAAAAVFAAGSLSGWMARDASVPQTAGIGALTQEAVYSYATFGVDRSHPVEIGATGRDNLVRWVSRRLQRPVDVPDLASAGYRFIGGRVVPTPNGPAGMFMYENVAGQRIAVVLRPMKIEVSAPMTERSIDAVGTVSWVDAGIGYSLVGKTPARRLHPIADEVRRQNAA